MQSSCRPGAARSTGHCKNYAAAQTADAHVVAVAVVVVVAMEVVAAAAAAAEAGKAAAGRRRTSGSVAPESAAAKDTHYIAVDPLYLIQLNLNS